MNMSERIKQKRLELGLSQDQLAERAKISQPAIKKIEAGGNTKYVVEIANALGVSAVWLKTGMDNNGSLKEESATYNVGRGPAIKNSVPLISWVSAGYFCEVIDNFHPGDAEEWISTTVAVSENSYALRVRGDSMEPDFPEGSIIIIDPRREPQPGNYVIAKNGGEATFKQLTKDGSDRYLKPLNPQYPIKLIDEHMVICGVVVSMERKLV